jgi:hypothetical protein
MIRQLALALELLEDYRDPPADADLVAVGGAAGVAVDATVEAAIAHGRAVLVRLCRAAVARLLRYYPARSHPSRLFTDAERAELAGAFAAVR